MAMFPDLSRGIGAKGFTEVIDPEAVRIGKTASGVPVLNELFTWAGKTWKHTRYLVSQTDKESYLTFYITNRGVPFAWVNEQDGEEYEVVFLRPPQCTLDKLKNRWQIQFVFAQYTPL